MVLGLPQRARPKNGQLMVLGLRKRCAQKVVKKYYQEADRMAKREIGHNALCMGQHLLYLTYVFFPRATSEGFSFSTSSAGAGTFAPDTIRLAPDL